MADLTEWANVPDPEVRKKRSVTLGQRTVGYIAQDLRHNDLCYVSNRDSEDHRYHGEDPWYDLGFDGDGHGLSVDLFSLIHDADISRIYIAETDTGTVYQYAFSQFVDGEPINFEAEAKGRGYEKDPQKVVALDAAVEVYDGAYPGLYQRQPPFN